MADRPTAADDLRTQVRDAIHTSGRAQIILATELGISEKHLSQMLIGKARLTIEWAEKILHACGGDLHLTVIPGTLHAPVDRVRLDDLTSDGLDAMCDRLRRAERAVTLLAGAHRRAERAEQQLANVRALHRKASHGLVCVYCAPLQRIGYDATWPCDTIRALEGDVTGLRAAYCGSRAPHGIHDWQDYAQPCHCPGYPAALDSGEQASPDGERELRPCGQPTCLPNGAHRYMLGGRIHHCPGAKPSPAAERKVPPCG